MELYFYVELAVARRVQRQPLISTRYSLLWLNQLPQIPLTMSKLNGGTESIVILDLEINYSRFTGNAVLESFVPRHDKNVSIIQKVCYLSALNSYHSGASVFFTCLVLWTWFLPIRTRTNGSLVPLLSTPRKFRASTRVIVTWPSTPVAASLLPRIVWKDMILDASERVRWWREWLLRFCSESFLGLVNDNDGCNWEGAGGGAGCCAGCNIFLGRIVAAEFGDSVLLELGLGIVVAVRRVSPSTDVCVFLRINNCGCQRNLTRIYPLTPSTPFSGMLTCLATKLSTRSPRSDMPPEPNGTRPLNLFQSNTSSRKLAVTLDCCAKIGVQSSSYCKPRAAEWYLQ